MERPDVIIVGGGPSGTATAMGLVRMGRSVLLLERSHYHAWRVGEFLWPWVRTLLEQLGVWGRFLQEGHTPSHGISSAWGGSDLGETDFIFNPHGSGWHIDRRRFDAMMADAADRAGAIVRTGARVVSVTRRFDGWQVVVEQDGNTFEADAPFLVDASGRSRRLARILGSRWISHDRQIGLVGILAPQAPDSSAPCVLLLEAAEHGWWYSGPLPDQSLLVAYLTDGDYLTTSRNTPTTFWSDQLERTIHTAARVRGFELRGDVRVRAAGSGRLDRAAGPGWLAVGDSASTFDPLTGSGIPKALRGALRAAPAISEEYACHGAVFEEYVREIVADFDKYLEQRVAYCRMERRWTDSPFWRRRQATAADAVPMASTPVSAR